jgi:uncharacterized protein DUF620
METEMKRNPFARALGLATLALAVSAGAASAQQSNLPPAQQLVEKYVQAIGGRDAIARLQARHETSEVSMPAMGMTMTVESYAARPNKQVTRMEMSGMQIAQGYNGEVAWASDPMRGPRLLTGTELAQVQDLSAFDLLFDFAHAFRSMETIGERTIDGQPCWNVRMTAERGSVMEVCFDKATGLVTGSHSVRHTEMGDVPVDATYSEYREFDGVKMPTVSNVDQAGQHMVMTLKSVSHAALADSTFELPADVKALQH